MKMTMFSFLCFLPVFLSYGLSTGKIFPSFGASQVTSVQVLEKAAIIVVNQHSRVRDSWGGGQFKAQRDHGVRMHNGLDVVADAGEKIYSPIDGNVVREAVPYKDDNSYKGVVLQGTGAWAGFQVKIFYVQGEFSGLVKKGSEIGVAQNLTMRYPGITNHVHVEVKNGTIQIDPFEIWQISF